MDPDPDPTPFFIDFKDAIKYVFILDHKHIIFAKICIKILFCRHFFSPLNTFMRKEKDPDPDPGGPKTCRFCRSGSGSGSPILEKRMPGTRQTKGGC
jgi:hypothetical protein